MNAMSSANARVTDNALPESPLGIRAILERSVGDVFLDGNDVNIFHNGDEIFPPMLDAIESASHSIKLATYVYWQGDIADKFADALAAAARRGVKVKVLLDAHGAKKIKDSHVDAMQSAGVEVRWFRPLATWKLWRLDKRTHRKLLICDDQVGFTGGVGIADEWGGDARNPDEWRDIHASLRGPAVSQLHAAFWENWCEAGDWQEDRPEEYPSPQPDGLPVMTVRSESTLDWTNIATLVRTLVQAAKTEIVLVTAYFAPDPVLLKLLVEALERGVAVKILVPGPYTDSRLSQLAGGPSVETLLAEGAQVWEYQKTMLHTKLAVIDGHTSLIGSPNLNHRSMGKDEECCVVILAEDVAERLLQKFSDDCADARALDAGDWSNRGLLRRLAERLAGTIIEEL